MSSTFVCIAGLSKYMPRFGKCYVGWGVITCRYLQSGPSALLPWHMLPKIQHSYITLGIILNRLINWYMCRKGRLDVHNLCNIQCVLSKQSKRAISSRLMCRQCENYQNANTHSGVLSFKQMDITIMVIEEKYTVRCEPSLKKVTSVVFEGHKRFHAE